MGARCSCQPAPQPTRHSTLTPRTLLRISSSETDNVVRCSRSWVRDHSRTTPNWEAGAAATQVVNPHVARLRRGEALELLAHVTIRFSVPFSDTRWWLELSLEAVRLFVDDSNDSDRDIAFRWGSVDHSWIPGFLDCRRSQIEACAETKRLVARGIGLCLLPEVKPCVWGLLGCSWAATRTGFQNLNSETKTQGTRASRRISRGFAGGGITECQNSQVLTTSTTTSIVGVSRPRLHWGATSAMAGEPGSRSGICG